MSPGWRNWQTRRTQNPVPATACGFDSRPGHRWVLDRRRFDNTIQTEQHELCPADAAREMLRRPQVATRTANDAAFQPGTRHDHPLFGESQGDDNAFRLVPGERGTAAGARGDTSPTHRNTEADPGADMCTGGEPDADPFKAGLQNPGDTFHRGVTDWPEQAGTGSGPNLQSPDNV